ncbi:MAG TPA: carboxymuconolactone decarboxylase family protein [Gemmatimonadota bacterium]|nr:carboxymuconolactone decarboxylase family protein [Gemmatimonadota bacterium]
MAEPRIPRLPTDGNAAAVQAIFDRFLEERGNVPNMFRVVARREGHLTTMIRHFGAVMREGSVPRALKEMLSIRVSALNGCDY